MLPDAGKTSSRLKPSSVAPRSWWSSAADPSRVASTEGRRHCRATSPRRAPRATARPGRPPPAATHGSQVTSERHDTSADAGGSDRGVVAGVTVVERLGLRRHVPLVGLRAGDLRDAVERHLQRDVRGIGDTRDERLTGREATDLELGALTPAHERDLRGGCVDEGQPGRGRGEHRSAVECDAHGDQGGVVGDGERLSLEVAERLDDGRLGRPPHAHLAHGDLHRQHRPSGPTRPGRSPSRRERRRHAPPRSGRRRDSPSRPGRSRAGRARRGGRASREGVPRGHRATPW